MGKIEVNLDHVAIRVSDIERAYAWFDKAFGFSQILPPGKVDMKASGKRGQRCCITNSSGIVLELEQVQDDSVVIQGNTKSVISHIAFQTKNLDAIHEHLLNLGYIDKNVAVKDMKVVHILYFIGIDGVEIELIEYQK